MAQRTSFIRHITALAAIFTGNDGEVTVDSTKQVVRVHDALTPGGVVGAREDLSTSPAAIGGSNDGKMTAAQAQALVTATSNISTNTADILLRLLGSSNLSDLPNVSQARTNLGVDVAGTDNSTDVSIFNNAQDYISILGQVLTLGAIDLTADVIGILPNANGGAALNIEKYTAVTQTITAGGIDIDFSVFDTRTNLNGWDTVNGWFGDGSVAAGWYMVNASLLISSGTVGDELMMSIKVNTGFQQRVRHIYHANGARIFNITGIVYLPNTTDTIRIAIDNLQRDTSTVFTNPSSQCTIQFLGA